MHRTDILTAASQAFLAEFDRRLERILANTAHSLQLTADVAEASPVAHACLTTRTVLLRQRAPLRESLLARLEALLARSMTTSFNRFWQPLPLVVPGGSISLRDTRVIDQELELETLTARLRSAASQPLAQVTARIANLFNAEYSKERENPFRPFMLSSAVASATAGLGLLGDLNTLLRTTLIEAMREEMHSLYGKLNDFLHEVGVQRERPFQIARGTSTHVVPSRLADCPKRSELLRRWVQIRTSTDAATTTATLGDAIPAGTLLRQLLNDTSTPDAPSRAIGVVTYSGSVLLANAVRRLERQHLAARSAQPGTVADNQVLAHRVPLSGLTEDAGERTVIDAVGRLFEYVQRDAHIPDDVKAHLVDIQFRVLLLGLFDPIAFARPDHPSRRLMNRVGSVAVGLGITDAASTALRAEIGAIFQALLATTDYTEQPFVAALQRLEHFLDHQLPSIDPLMAQARHAMQAAEAWTHRRHNIARELAAATQGLPLHPCLSAFLQTAWPQVIERSQRNQPEQAGRLRAITPALIWSTLPKADAAARSTLLRKQTAIVLSLVDGLPLSDWSTEQQLHFLDWLIQTQIATLRANDDPNAIALAVLKRRCHAFIDSDGTEADWGGEYDGSVDLAHLAEAVRQFNATLTVLDGEQAPSAASGVIAQLTAEEDYRARVQSRLSAGVAVVLLLGGVPRQARITWISPRAASLLAKIDGVAEPTAISIPLFRTLLAAEQVRFMEDEPLFERTVAALLRGVGDSAA